MQSAARAPTLISIQLLRALACLLVLLHHARNPKPWFFDPLAAWNFTPGVEIFFVISGFIMYAAAREERPAEFVRRRVIRVVPLYWIATLTWVAWLAFRDLPSGGAAHLALSMAMIPHESPIHPGLVWPALIPGWTLNYEMAFYALFAAGLAARRVMTVTFGVILALVAAGALLHPADPVAKAFTAPILLAFLAGVGIAWLHARASFDKARPLAAAGAAALAAHATPWVEMPRVWVVAASASVVAGALAFEAQAQARRMKGLEAIGDASYAIYLFHTLVLAVVMWAGRKLPIEGWPQFLLLMTAGMGASVLAGLAVHRWVETPMLKVLLRLGRPSLPPRRQEASQAA